MKGLNEITVFGLSQGKKEKNQRKWNRKRIN
jgi:hypothetical protein